MSNSYQVLGTTVPPMLGRNSLIKRIERQILKPSPDHVQVVGPTLFGKSVLLNELARRHVRNSTHYLTSAYVDLRHETPSDDVAFKRRFATVVKEALSIPLTEIGECIRPEDDNVYEYLCLAFDELEKKSVRLLIVLDGFDHVLAGTAITRNLWDQLRSLAQKTSLRLVTGSRRPLRELCKSEDSRTSHFWEVFNPTPAFVGPFTEDDWTDLLQPLARRNIAADSSATKELVNWTGGVPVLAAALLCQLANTTGDGQSISKEAVDTAANGFVDGATELLKQLWDDCTIELRSDLAALATSDNQGVPVAGVSTQRQRALEERGYGVTSGSKLRSSCRIIVRFAEAQGPAVADLKRLFGDESDFMAHIGGLLDLRIEQLALHGADAQLVNYLKHSTHDIVRAPEISLVTIRSLVQRALQLIWNAELGSNRTLPDDWITEWKHCGVNAKWLLDDRKRVPVGDGQQMHALDLLTGKRLDHEHVERKAKHLTKTTLLLLKSLHDIGDFGQHLAGYSESTPSTGFAATVVFNAIEMVSALSKDLSSTVAGVGNRSPVVPRNQS